MKTAISLPDETFRAAERLAKDLGMSRSELYARAVEEYVKRVRESDVTEALNRYYGDHPQPMDPVIETLQEQVLRSEEW